MRFICGNSRISREEILEIGKPLVSYAAFLKDLFKKSDCEFPESVLYLPFDENILEGIRRVKEEKITNNLKYIFLIGIGGSSLGAKAVYDALRGFYDSLDAARFPKIIFLETFNDRFLGHLEKFIHKEIGTREEFIINAVSKSGATLESQKNLDALRLILNKKFGNVNDRIVMTTDKGSVWWDYAKERGISLLLVPEKVGGRYSVMSSVGLFPLSCAGIDIEKLREGARDVVADCASGELKRNTAALSAAILFAHFVNKKQINDNFFFLEEFESLGKWYRQLMSESLGKEGKGITPTVSIGSSDLHSMLELYFGGPKDKFTTFIWSDFAERDNLSRAIYRGTKNAYIEKEIPFCEIILEDISEKSLGEFLEFKMLEIMYLGKLFGIDAFSQGEVELYKKEVRKILKE